MTLVLAWYSRQGSRDVLHVATDSLLSQDKTNNRWVHATKIFRVYPSHSYIAYCGSSLYGLSAIAQGIGLLSQTDILHREGTTLKARAKALGEHMGRVLSTFPESWGNEATLLFCGHDPCLHGIRAVRIDLKGGREKITDAIADDKRFIALGSGASFASALVSKSVHSRDFFAALTATIRDKSQVEVGGCPQAVTLFCHKNDAATASSTVSGFNWDVGPRYESTLFGVPLRFASRMSKVIFRTALFTRDRYLREATVRRVGW